MGPYFVDWTGYRGDFEREVSRILGRRVTVEGDVTARLLPFPSVSFTDVRVAGETENEPAMTIEEFSMDAELAPFMRGEILIFDMRLVRPKATIQIAQDGQVDWAVRPSTRFDPTQIELENVRVIEGKVTLLHEASGRQHTLTEINADIAAGSLAGPWRMDGSLRLDGMLTDVAVSTGAANADGTMRVRIRANPERYPIALEADGSAQFKPDMPLYAGTFRFEAQEKDAPMLRGSDGRTFEATDKNGDDAAEYRFSGSFALDHRRLDVPEFRLETGPRADPYTADGTALIDLGKTPRFLIQATGAQMRFDEAIGKDSEFSGATLADRVEALKAALENVPRPSIPGTVDVDLPAVVAGDTTIRNVRLSAEPSADGWSVNTLSALLPGRTTLEASGYLDTREEQFGFKGKLLLAVAQPSGFAAWVARDVDDAIRRLPAAGFQAEVELDERRQLFRDVELVLGNTRFSGSLERIARDKVRPALIARLEGDALDVEGMAAFASLFVSDAGVTHFAGHDVDFDLAAGPVTLAGMTADEVNAALRLREDHVEVDRLSIIGLAGANISATATIEDIGDEPSGSVDASVLAPDLAPLLHLLAARFPHNSIALAAARRASAFPAMMADAQIDLVASLARNRGAADVSLTAQGHAGGNDFTFSSAAKGFDGDWRTADVSADLTADSSDAAQLLALYGLPAFDLGVTEEGHTKLSLQGEIGEGAELGFEVSSPEARTRFDGTVRAGQEDGYAAAGQLVLSGRDFEPWLMTTGIALPGMGMGMAAELTADAAYAAGSLTLEDIDGTVADVPLSGKLNAELSEGLPFLRGTLALGGFDMVNAAGLVLGQAALQDDGDGWPATPFAEAMLLPFHGILDLTFDTLDIGYSASARNVAMTARLDADGLRLSDISAEMLGGKAQGLVELRNNAGTGLLSAQVAIEDGDAAGVLGAPGLAGGADISAAVTASGKSVSGMVASLAGSGTAHFDDLVIPGVDPDAFGAIIAGADEIGRAIDASKVAGYAPGILGEGVFAAQDVDVPFTIAAGVVRTPPIYLNSDGAIMEIEVKADIAANDISAEGTLRYDEGNEALVGSEPVVGINVRGPYGETVRSFDTQPLAQFLTQRALEREQARVEAMQAGLLEKQRLRREVRYYQEQAEQHRVEAEEQARRQAEEAERLRVEADAAAVRQAEEAAAAAEQRRIDEETRKAEEAAARARQDEEAARGRERVAPGEEALLGSPIDGKSVSDIIRREPLPAGPVRRKPPDTKFDPKSIEQLLKTFPDRP